MSYKCRGKLEKKIKAVEMPNNDFSIATLTKKFSDVCGGTVALQYKGRTLLSDDDVKNALDDCYSQKKLYLELDLIKGAGVAAPIQKQAPPQQQSSSVPPVKTQSVQQSSSQQSSSTNVGSVAEGILNKYQLSSPRENQQQQQPQQRQPQQVQHEAPKKTVTTTPAPQQSKPEPKYSYASSNQSQSQPKPKSTVPLKGGIEATLRNELNQLRSNPSSFSQDLQNRASGYEGSILKVKRGDVMFKAQTNEGVKACNDALSFVRNAKSVGQVQFMSGLSEASREIINFMGPQGARKPSSNDMGAIIDKHGSYEGTLSQVIAYIYEDDVRATILDLLVCDGDSSRHTANLLMNGDYKFSGVAVSEAEKGQPKLCVIQFVTVLWSDL